MSNAWEGFTKNMQQQIEFYQRLVILEKAKQDVLVENNLKELEIITAKEEELLLQINRLEEGRLHWACFFSEAIGKRAEEITLKDMITLHSPLNVLSQDFEETVNELRLLHESNTKMLENAVSIINFTIESLTREKRTTYGNPKNRDKREKTGFRSYSLIDKSI